MNWILVLSQYNSPLSSIYFINSQTGYIGCGDGGLYKTTDGGISFSTILTVPAVRSIFFSDSQFGYFGGDPYIYKTENGGNNWAQVYYSGPSNVSSLYFVNFLTGFATGHNTILKTTDFGENWSTYPLQDYYFRTNIFFSDSQHGMITGNTDFPNYYPLLEKTTNGGINWTRQSIETSSSLYGLYLINNNTGWICGSDGIILKTTTGGNVSISHVSTEVPDKYSLSQNYPNPFNPSTVIRYQLSAAGFTTLKVFDLLGKEVASLVNEKQNAGSYAVEFNSSEYSLPSGIYFYTLSAEDYKETRKMVLIK